MEQFVFNLTFDKVRRVKKGGRTYIVVEATSIVPGVLNGSNGPILYPLEELRKNPRVWNGMPIVNYHPTSEDGQPLSARHPDVIEKYGLGYMYKTQVNNKLQHELWFDEEITKSVNNTIYQNLLTRTPMEVSTGLDFDMEKASTGSIYNGVPYIGVARNLRPDHLAILPDKIGACSIADGCGVFNEEIETTEEPDKSVFRKVYDALRNVFKPDTQTPVVTDNAKLSHDDVRSQLSLLIQAHMKQKAKDAGLSEYGYGYCYVTDVFDREFIYSTGSKLFKAGYRTDNRTGSVELTDDSHTEVRAQTSYKAINEETPPVETPTENVETNGTNETNTETPVDPVEADMAVPTKPEMVTYLTTNCACWKQAGSKEALEKMDDAVVKNIYDETVKSIKEKKDLEEKLVANTKKAEPPQLYALLDGKMVPVDMSKYQATNTQTTPAPTPVDSASRLTAEEREILEYANASRTREKAATVELLLVNVEESARPATRELLMTKNMSELSLMLRLQPPRQLPSELQQTQNYSGLGVGQFHVTQNTEQPDVMDLDATNEDVLQMKKVS